MWRGGGGGGWKCRSLMPRCCVVGLRRLYIPELGRDPDKSSTTQRTSSFKVSRICKSIPSSVSVTLRTTILDDSKSLFIRISAQFFFIKIAFAIRGFTTNLSKAQARRPFQQIKKDTTSQARTSLAQSKPLSTALHRPTSSIATPSNVPLSKHNEIQLPTYQKQHPSDHTTYIVQKAAVADSA